MLENRETKGMGGALVDLWEAAAAGSGEKQNGHAKVREIEPLAIISNRSDHIHEVPWIGGERGEARGLSNTSYEHPDRKDYERRGRASLAQMCPRE